MDRNIAKLFQTTLTFYNRRIPCNTRNNANILTIQLRNNSTARFKVAEDKGTLSGLKAPQKPKPSFQTNALLLSVPIVTFCLGTWQVKRREWKLKLIDELENKTRQPAIDLPEDLSELENLTYRRVKLRGRFDHSLEMYLGPRTVLHDNSADSEGSGGLMSTDIRARTGYLVVTPFILADSGKRILVNRGWVNTKLVPKERRLEGQVEGEVEITGIVRDNEERGTFVGKNIKSIRIFHYRHLKTMAELGDTLPYYVDACVESSVEGGPLGGQTNLTLRNEHTSYIITWYSLSAITFVMWLRMVLK